MVDKGSTNDWVIEIEDIYGLLEVFRFSRTFRICVPLRSIEVCVYSHAMHGCAGHACLCVRISYVRKCVYKDTDNTWSRKIYYPTNMHVRVP